MPVESAQPTFCTARCLNLVTGNLPWNPTAWNFFHRETCRIIQFPPVISQNIQCEMGEVASFSAVHSASTLCRNFVTLCRNFVLHASGWFNFTSPLQLHSAALHAAFVSFQLFALAQCVPFFSLPLGLNSCTVQNYTLYSNCPNHASLQWPKMKSVA